jgi:hypothetical protein
MYYEQPLCLTSGAKIKVYLILDASSIRQRNNLIQLEVAILTVLLEYVEAYNVTDLGSSGNEKVGSALR